MRKQRIYIDTSVIGGCFDEEFAEWSLMLFNEFITGEKIAVISTILIGELSKAPDYISNKIKEIPTEYIELVPMNTEIESLAKSYICNGAISEKYSDDALHIAAATVYKVDVLVSWNFKHIVNLRRIQLYNSINLMHGCAFIEIRTPREVVRYEK